MQPSLAFNIFARETVAFCTKQEIASISITWNRGKSGDIHTYLHTYIQTYIHPNLWNKAGIDAGDPGWSRTPPKLVCCEVWWLRSNYMARQIRAFWLVLSWSGICHTDRFRGNGHTLCIFCFRKPANSKQAWPECHIINYLLSSLARAVWGILARGRFCTDLAALGPYCHDLGPIFPSTALALG